jgi:hypothetical protein
MRSILLVGPLLFAQLTAAQSPLLHRVSPLAIAAGKTTEVKLIGERLGEITDLWCSAANVRLIPTNDARLIVTTPASAAGVIALRVGTTNGVSDVAMFLIDAVPSIQESVTNKAVTSAQFLRRPVAIDGTTDELAFDFYSLDAKRGETISIEALASRIGSKLDPVLRILDEEKHELAFCEDASGAGRDCRLQFRAPKSGRYVIEVRDIAYSGGPQHFYRLRVGKFAFPTCTYPLAAAPGSEMCVLGPWGERFSPAKIKLVTAAPSYVPVSGSFLPVRSDDLPFQHFERELNDTQQEANLISLPHVINGRFEKAKDRDCFQIDVKKDERWVFATRSRSFGSPCDVFLELRDAEGKTIVECNPSGPQDTTLTHEFKNAGRYLLIAKELADRGAPDFAYQIDAKPFEPTFTLALDDDKIEAKPGGEFSIAVSCARSEFNDKIDVELEGLPENFTVENANIESKKTNATLKVKVPETAQPGELLAFRVVGRAGEKRAVASTISALRRNFVTMLYPPAELDGVVALGITAGDPAPKGRRRRS